MLTGALRATLLQVRPAEPAGPGVGAPAQGPPPPRPRRRLAALAAKGERVGSGLGGRGGRGRLFVVLVSFSVTPLGVGEGVSGPVSRAVRIVRDSGLPNETSAMFTTVEGEWDEVMALVRACMDAVLEEAPRVSVVLKIDERPGHDGALTAKVEAVERRLAEGAADV